MKTMVMIVWQIDLDTHPGIKFCRLLHATTVRPVCVPEGATEEAGAWCFRGVEIVHLCADRDVIPTADEELVDLSQLYWRRWRDGAHVGPVELASLIV